jgi:hypothetical protein
VAEAKAEAAAQAMAEAAAEAMAEAAAEAMDSGCGGRNSGHQVMATCDDLEAVVVAALTQSLEA